MHFTLKFFCGFILYSITVWTIIGNIFILIALSSNKQLKKNGISNILIGNLAFSDLLLGLAVLPFSATFSTFKFFTFSFFNTILLVILIYVFSLFIFIFYLTNNLFHLKTR